MELKIKMMQSGLEGKLEEGRSRDSQLATAREETLRLRHRWANTVTAWNSPHHNISYISIDCTLDRYKTIMLSKLKTYKTEGLVLVMCC